MLQTLAIVLLILWVLGLVSSYTMGGLIHILLVVAIVMSKRPAAPPLLSLRG